MRAAHMPVPPACPCVMETFMESHAPDAFNAHTAMRAAYQRLVSSSPDGIFAFDSNLECTVWNPGMTRLSQVPQDDALGKPISALLRVLGYDDDASLIEVLLDNTIILEDRAYPRADKSIGYLAGHLSPLRDEAGTIIGGLAVWRDITESRHVAQALQARLRETLLLNRVIAAASTMEWQTALASITTELAQALNVPQAAIALLNERRTHLSIVSDYHPDAHVSVLGATIPLEKNQVTNFVLQHNVPLAIADVRTDERFDIVRDLVTQRGIASMLLVPLIVRERVIGTLDLDSFEPREFTAEEIALAQNVAAAVSQALHHAQLYDDLELERAYLLLANDAGRILTAQVSMRGVIHAALSLASRLGAQDSYVLALDDGEPLYFESTFPPTFEWTTEQRRDFARRLVQFGLEKSALESRQSVIVDDTRSDPRWYQAPEHDSKTSVGSVVAVPFFGTRSTLSGVLAYHHSTPYRFDTRAAGVIELIGRYLATAMENARLFEQNQAALAERERAEKERLALERKMLEAQKLESLGVLAGGIAHDFNNLLVTMLGNAGLALMEVNAESRARHYVEQFQIAAQRAADLTRQMLAYSGKGRFIVQPVSLNDVIEEMVRLLRVSISKQAVLQLQLAPQLPLISADATQLRQVVMNLITNASDALAEHPGTITVSTGSIHMERADLYRAQPTDALPTGEYVFLEVADTGSGMDAETQARIFEPFFTTKFTGRGLGLAAVLGIMRGHQGAIQVHSTTGQGTTFRLLFPPQTAALCPLPAPTISLAPKTRARVLIVDDEEMVREVTMDLLRRFGYEIVGAENGTRALELARAQEFDCVVLDLTMPGMSGEDTLRHLRALHPALRVVLMSGYSEHETTARFRGMTLDGFIQKPFTPTDLDARIQAALAKIPTTF